MKKIASIVGIGIVIFGVLTLGIFFSSQSNSQNTDSEATADSRQPVSAIPNDAYVLDVRTPEEYASGHATIAQNLPLQSLEAGTLPPVNKGQKIYVYCRSGNRSAQATALLREVGYTNLEDLGGVEDARAVGLEFTN